MLKNLTMKKHISILIASLLAGCANNSVDLQKSPHQVVCTPAENCAISPIKPPIPKSPMYFSSGNIGLNCEERVIEDWIEIGTAPDKTPIWGVKINNQTIRCPSGIKCPQKAGEACRKE